MVLGVMSVGVPTVYGAGGDNTLGEQGCGAGEVRLGVTPSKGMGELDWDAHFP